MRILKKTTTTDKIVQPKQTVQFYYELAVALIAVPAIMLFVAVMYMKRKKPINNAQTERKASAI